MNPCQYCGNPLQIAAMNGVILATFCQHCGSKRLAEARRAEIEDAKREAQLTARARIARAGVPPILSSATVANIYNRDVANRVEAAVSSGRSLTLTGPVGTGKSWAAAAWLRSSATAGASVGWMCSRFDGWDEVRKVARARCVVLDDVDLIHPDAVQMVVDSVRSVGGSICLTSNQAPADLAVRLGDRVVDRLRPVISVEFSGKSRRGEQVELSR